MDTLAKNKGLTMTATEAAIRFEKRCREETPWMQQTFTVGCGVRMFGNTIGTVVKRTPKTIVMVRDNMDPRRSDKDRFKRFKIHTMQGGQEYVETYNRCYRETK